MMSQPQQAPAVRITGLTRAFGSRTILDGLRLDIADGEFVALLGRSGSGKSTLLRTLAGLDPAPAATVSVPTRRSVVFQEPRLVPWKSVWKNVVLGLRRHSTFERAERALHEVGLAGHARAWPLTLSGGEAQRVALARALVRDPQLLLLDEPFAALDALTRMTMQRLVLNLWHKLGCAVLLVTHDVDEALLVADRALVLDQGRITKQLPISVPRADRLGHPAIRALRNEILTALGVEPNLFLASGEESRKLAG